MFDEVEPDRDERLAAHVADVVASLWFPVALAIGIALWVIINVVGRPFEPYPMVMIAGLAVGLTTITAAHGPLILLAQRHATARDRSRDIETYRVSANSERDLHELRQQIAELTERLDGGGAS